MRIKYSLPGSLFLAFLMISGLGLQSCQQCITCRASFTNDQGNTTVIHEGRSYCDSDDNLDDYEDQYMDEWENKGYDVECMRD